MLLSFLGAIALFSQWPSPAGDSVAAADHACVEAGSTNGVLYQTSSAEWSWSPDGESIVYDRAVGEVSQLHIRQIPSGIDQCITSGDLHDTHPNWSPDGNWIAFVRRVDKSPQIHLLNVQDRSVHPVTDPGRPAQDPAFSRDGSRLAYVRYPTDDARRRFVMVRQLAAGEETEVFDSPFGLNNLSWTADGTAVLLYSIEDWNDIYEAKADGSGVRRLTYNTVTDTYSAEYSPDGARLVFGQGSEDSPYSRWFNYDLYQKDLNTGDVRRLTWTFGADDRVRHSPDGKTIGFVTRRSGYPEIYFMDADGSNLRAMTRQPDGELSAYIRREGVRAGRAYFDDLRRENPDARLISEAATSVLTNQFIARRQAVQAVLVAQMGDATHRDSWRTRTALGLALMAAGDSNAAHQTLRQSLSIFPNQYQLVFVLGFEGFARNLDSIDGIYRKRGPDIYDLVLRLRTRGSFLSAISLLYRLDEANPDDTDVLNTIAYTQMMLGDHSAAIATYKRVLALDPTYEDALFHLGRIEDLEEIQLPPRGRRGAILTVKNGAVDRFL